jgi:hypothetical protein
LIHTKIRLGYAEKNQIELLAIGDTDLDQASRRAGFTQFLVKASTFHPQNMVNPKPCTIPNFTRYFFLVVVVVVP